MGALLSFLCVLIVYGRFSFLLSKNDENLIWSLECVSEFRSQETSLGVRKYAGWTEDCHGKSSMYGPGKHSIGQ